MTKEEKIQFSTELVMIICKRLRDIQKTKLKNDEITDEYLQDLKDTYVLMMDPTLFGLEIFTDDLQELK